MSSARYNGDESVEINLDEREINALFVESDPVVRFETGAPATATPSPTTSETGLLTTKKHQREQPYATVTEGDANATLPKQHKRRRHSDNHEVTWPRKSASHTGLRGLIATPKHVHNTDWRDMLAIASTSENATRAEHATQAAYEVGHGKMRTSSSSSLRSHWIEMVFQKRECSKFIVSSRDPNKCACGRLRIIHSPLALNPSRFLTAVGPPRSNLDAPDRHGVFCSEYDLQHSAVDSDNGNHTSRRSGRNLGERWTIGRHTMPAPTDAFGTIEFQGGPHPYKAQYLRLSFDSNPADIMTMFDKVWQIPAPKLIITVHGGVTNFDMQPKLARVFRKGLIKAAKTTGAWIVTSGINAGVVRHVAAAIESAGSTMRARSRIVCIGIAPWGMLKKREDLVGKDLTVPYHPSSFSPKGRFAVLNNRHSYFLLVDNGTVGRNECNIGLPLRCGADIILRKRLEEYIVQKQKISGGTRSVPVVCVALEGGTYTIRTVLDYVTNIPPVPVVVCDGSGRAADLLAFAHQYIQEDGSLPETIRPQLLGLVENVFGFSKQGAEKLILELMLCVKRKHLMTVFRLGENQNPDLDHAILTALLRGQNLTAPDQLALALAWNRVDIARSDIFVLGQEWPPNALHNAMMEALVYDRVDFVRLLLENGVSMQKFLTIERLEELYNTDKGPQNTLYYIVRDVVRIRSGYRYRLPHIGLAIEKLMGSTFQSSYNSVDFRAKYAKYRTRKMEHHKKFRNDSIRSSKGLPGGHHPSSANSMINAGPESGQVVDAVMAAIAGSRALSNHILFRSGLKHRESAINKPSTFAEHKDTVIEMEDESLLHDGRTDGEYDFQYPFSDLLVWAVLTKRQEMALCMWQHGEEAMAKALVACRLYKSLSKEAAEDYLEVEVCEELKKYAEEFRRLSIELLEHCYLQDDDTTLQLLTYELCNWGRQTCLSLAVLVNNMQFIAHPCCQILLADLWHGGLRIRRYSNLKVVAGLLFPPYILRLEFKSREELMAQPQTAAEHEEDINESSSSSSESSDDDDHSSSSSSADEGDDPFDSNAKRRNSIGSTNSINLATLFHSRRRRRRAGASSTAPPHQTSTGTLPSNSANNVPECPQGIATVAASVHKHRSTSTRPTPMRQGSDGQKGMQSPTMIAAHQTRADGMARHHSADGAMMNAGGSHPAFGPTTTPPPPYPTMPPAYAGNDATATLQIPSNNLARSKPIKFRRKLYEFFVAPITTFWAWTFSFVVFLTAFTYAMLIRTPEQPSVIEWYMLAVVVAFGLEYARRFFMSEPPRIRHKFEYFLCHYWNSVTTIAIITFFLGFALRMLEGEWRTAGRLILACNYILWTMKLLDFMSIHPRMGPYITMAGKMVQNMTYVVVMLCVALLGFGLARQAISYPDEDWHWVLVRNIFYKPYFMLYGEVYAGEIDTCNDDAWDKHMEEGVSMSDAYGNETHMSHTCVTGSWIPPLIMTCFLLIANILLMSMLLAIFNNIFNELDTISQQIWLFQRYRQVMEYESAPFLPPPFTPIFHVYMIAKYFRIHKRSQCCRAGMRGSDTAKRSMSDGSQEKRKKMFDFSLKLFLDSEQVEKLHDFEENAMEDLAREKEYRKNSSNEERIHRTTERADLLLVRMNDLIVKEAMLKGNVREMESRLEIMEGKQNEVLDYLRQITSTLSTLLPAIHGTRPPNTQMPIPSTSVVYCGDETTPAELLADDVAILSTTASSTIVDQTIFLMPSSAPRTRTATICVDDGDSLGRHQSMLEHRKPGEHQRPRYGSLMSLDPSVLAAATATRRRSPCGSVRRRRHHEEYTSITDAISIYDKELTAGALFTDAIVNELQALSSPVHDTEEEMALEGDDEEEEVVAGLRSETPITSLQRARPSYVRLQNSLLREYEEVGSRIAGELLERRLSKSTSSHPPETRVAARRRDRGESESEAESDFELRSLAENGEEDREGDSKKGIKLSVNEPTPATIAGKSSTKRAFFPDSSPEPPTASPDQLTNL